MRYKLYLIFDSFNKIENYMNFYLPIYLESFLWGFEIKISLYSLKIQTVLQNYIIL